MAEIFGQTLISVELLIDPAQTSGRFCDDVSLEFIYRGLGELPHWILMKWILKYSWPHKGSLGTKSQISSKCQGIYSLLEIFYSNAVIHCIISGGKVSFKYKRPP